MKNEVFPHFQGLTNRLRFEILHHGYTYGDKAWNFQSNHSPYNRLYFFLKGEAKVEHRGKWTTLLPGHAYLLPLHQVYYLKAEKAFEKFYLHFRLEPWPGKDLFENPTEQLPLERKDARVAELIARAKRGGIDDLLVFKGQVYLLLEDFVKKSRFRFQSESAKSLLAAEKYRPFFAEVESRPFNEIVFSKIADRMQISLPVLSRNFRKDTGKTLKEFLHLHFARRAQDELLLTSKKVREISHDLGFSDEYYFSRFFKKEVDLSPQQYRLQNRLEDAAKQ
ncbi:MAG: helix-turn-helix domain-containing protein [Spirochaetia bacterium]|nr:helix-turn-helix domain-containing protein [Spirochaetia bacterium]